MARTLTEVVGSLPPERQARVSARHLELEREVEDLRQLRKVVGKAQSEIAFALKIKQPSVSKIERQADMYLSTLRTYVEALGGHLELVVHLPDRPPMKLHGLADLVQEDPPRPQARASRRVKAPAAA
jgi:hypothetical protein